MANFFSNLFGSGATGEAAEMNRNLSMQNYLRSLGFLDTGYQNSVDALGRGYDDATRAYEPLAALGTKYGAATTLGMDALGVNGAQGNQRAVDAFQTGPGYQFALDQGNQALDRRRAVTGMYASGNADLDTIKYSQGLANQEYGNWRDKLLGFTNPELAATSGAATGTAAAATGRGTNLTNLYQGDAANRVNALGSMTSGHMAANNAEAAAETQGARNLFGAGMSLASLAAGGLPGIGGGSGFNLSSLGFNPASGRSGSYF